MLATPPRRQQRRRFVDTVCGRRNCANCGRWRESSTDFGVKRWRDLDKTEPLHLDLDCKRCAGLRKKARKHSRRGHPCTPRPVPSPSEVKGILLQAVFVEMPAAQRYEYQLEGGLPLTSCSIASEDHDPTPVPQGCPSCFLHGGGPCTTCPDVGVNARMRDAMRRGLILAT